MQNMARKLRTWGTSKLHLTTHFGNENKLMFRTEADRQHFRQIAVDCARRLNFGFLRIRFQARGVLMLIGTDRPEEISKFESRVKGWLLAIFESVTPTKPN
jgi:hypothetical protein